MTLGGEAFAAAVETRLAGFEAAVQAELGSWRQARRERWEDVRARVEALTVQLALAKAALAQRLGRAPAPRRERVAAILGWVSAFDGDRQRVEDEIWASLRAARADEERLRARVRARAEELEGVGRRLGRDAGEALAEARASESGPLAQTPAGRALEASAARAVAELRAAVEVMAERATTDVRQLSGQAFPDYWRALRRFDETMAGRVSGGQVPGPVRPRAGRTAGRAARPDRKRARVPKFLLARFYRAGGLRRIEGAVEVTFVNPLGFCIIQGGDPIVVDGRPHPRERTVLHSGELRLGADELSEKRYLKFAKGADLRVTLDGLALGSGRHRIQCSLELRKLGWVDLDVEDTPT